MISEDNLCFRTVQRDVLSKNELSHGISFIAAFLTPERQILIAVTALVQATSVAQSFTLHRKTKEYCNGNGQNGRGRQSSGGDSSCF